MLVTVKGKSLRDGLQPPLTVTVRANQSKFGRDEKMVPKSDRTKIRLKISLDSNRPIQGFWTPAISTLRTLSLPASKKRQGTKSREVGHGLGSKRYGDLMSAPSSMVGGTLARRHPHVCRQGRSGECNGHLGGRSERINGRSAH